MLPHSNDMLPAYNWLVDELKVEILLSAALNLQIRLKNTLTAVCTSEEVLAHKQDIYEGVLSDKAIFEHILRWNQVKSLATYEKYLPDLKKMVKQRLIGSLSRKG